MSVPGGGVAALARIQRRSRRQTRHAIELKQIGFCSILEPTNNFF
jgi:hypothetical protein